MRKTFVAFFQLSLLLISIVAFSFMLSPTSAKDSLSKPSSCCEKTKDGAYCINTDEENCDTSMKISETSCETTSYCKLGTCYDSSEGICMENTPQNVCVSNGGTWDERELEEVPQCQLGCCIIADQAAFVSLVRCKRLSSFFGVENNYKKDITSEIQCIATAQSQDMGACVYEKDYERVCKFTTRADCNAEEKVESIETNTGGKKFFKDYLCSAEDLNTVCARQVSTTCHDGKVYWTDSCGNRENVYSSNKDKSWNKGRVAEPEQICALNDGSNKDCGNCDYLLGSRCAKWDGFLGKPTDSDYYCQRTECKDRYGNDRMNGESWCVYDSDVGYGLDRSGSRYFREICMDGEVVVEPCAEFRNEVCLQGTIETSEGEFGTAACRVNRWQDCVLQEEADDCLNIDKRDCMWLPPVTGMILGGGMESSSTKGKTFSNPTTDGSSFNNPTATGSAIAPITGMASKNDEDETVTNRKEGICVPNFPPGFEFWEDGESQSICSQASAKCVVVKEQGLMGGEDIIQGEECLEEDWAVSANRVCTALGDCGGYVNYVGKYTDDGYEWKEDKKQKEFAPNTINKISKGFIGFVIGGITGMSTADMYTMASGTGAKVGTAGTYDVLLEESVGGFSPAAAAPSTTPTPTVYGKSHASTFLQLKAGGFADAAFSGLVWAGIAYGVGYLIGSLFGMSDENTQALSTALAAGAYTYKFLTTYTWGQQVGTEAALAESATMNPGLYGAFGWALLVGAIVFAVMYKDVETEIVTFDCLPWQAPTGGNDCEKCNDDTLPCSEYRCKSLGQNCEIVNAGTTEEKCVNINPRDVDPPIIKPNLDVITKGHNFENVKNSPPGPGFTIVNLNSSDGCLKAFTPLEFGIQTDEPSQCKIDFNHTTKFDDMVAYVGGSNLFSYNHTERFSLPGAKSFEGSSLILQNGKDIQFFLRCKDRNGNENSAEYAVKMCIDPSPDTTAPMIKATSILNEGCVAENQNSVNVDFYVNEPANCRWDFEDTSYENMKNNMACSNKLYQVNANFLFTCSTELSGISRDGTKYYVRCEDQPEKPASERINNKESFVFTLKGSTELKIKNLMPNGTIFGAVNPAPVELFVQTLFGCNNGQSICYYSKTKDKDYIMFYDTNNEDGVSTQRQDLTDGKHKYFIKCVDAGGNAVENVVEFDLDIDTSAPVISRIYEENSNLKILTVRNSECSYSFDNCDFSFEEGVQMPYANTTTHVAEWNKDKIYYIKCRDEFRNEDADCSAIVKPSANFL